MTGDEDPRRSRGGLATHRSAYRRLASAIGLAPLRIPVSLTLVTVAAWAVMLHHAMNMSVPMGSDMSAPMGSAVRGVMDVDNSLRGVGVFVTVWTVMMGAMMLPSAAPMILTFAAVQARRDRNVAVPSWMFVAGYLLVWAYAGLVVYALLQTGLQTSKDLAHHVAWLESVTWAPLVLGATLTLAGLYQFTPLKRRCLRHCRSPSAFLRLHWRDGWEGAIVMGISHGLFCLGCCWALFSVMVAAGMMSVAWMIVMTLVVFAEKVMPYGPRISVAVAVGLIALGLLVGSGAVQLGG